MTNCSDFKILRKEELLSFLNHLKNRSIVENLPNENLLTENYKLVFILDKIKNIWNFEYLKFQNENESVIVKSELISEYQTISFGYRSISCEMKNRIINYIENSSDSGSWFCNHIETSISTTQLAEVKTQEYWDTWKNSFNNANEYHYHIYPRVLLILSSALNYLKDLFQPDFYRVLELGCGNGILTETFLKNSSYKNKIKLMAIDYNEKSVSEAKQYLSHHPFVEIKKMDVNQLEFDDYLSYTEPKHIVIASGFFNHQIFRTETVKMLIMKVSNVMQKNGIGIFVGLSKSLLTSEILNNVGLKPLVTFDRSRKEHFYIVTKV